MWINPDKNAQMGIMNLLKKYIEGLNGLLRYIPKLMLVKCDINFTMSCIQINDNLKDLSISQEKIHF